MLLIILGAGASFDSLSAHVLARISLEDRLEWCPPLANELLGKRRSFEEVLFDLPQCAGLASHLQRRIAAGANIEHELERLLEDAPVYPIRHRELMALRFYLQETLWRCSERWARLSSGRTLLAELFRRLDVWRHAANETVAITTFNYDVLLDQAMIGQLAMPLSTISGYISDSRYHVAKLHGSVNWARRVASPGGTTYAGRSHALNVIIDHAETLAMTEGDYFVRDRDQPLSESGFVYVPAIAIPTEAKKSFDCPEAQLTILRGDIPNVDRILVIGWRGAENHFLDELGQLRGMAIPVLVVGATEDGLKETTSNLMSIGLDETSIGWSATGFAAFMETNGLEAFLSASVRELRESISADGYAFGERPKSEE